MLPENKILFCGDPHGCFNNAIQAVYKYRPEAIVLLGDYNLEVPLEKYLSAIIGMTKIYWIPGNHDFDSKAEHSNLFNSALSYNNIHLKVIEVCGLKIAGLGGIFQQRIWIPGNIPKWIDQTHWRQCHSSRDIEIMSLYAKGAIWHHDFERMKGTVKADILVTHEAPSSHRHGFAVIDELAEAIGAKHIFHGHHHEYYTAQLANEIDVAGVSIGGVVNLAGEQLICRR